MKTPRERAIENLKKFLAKSEAGRFQPKETPAPVQDELSPDLLEGLKNLPSEE